MTDVSANLIGLKPSGGKFYLPHYCTVPDLYANTRITHVESKSVMHTQEGVKALDFWNLDADVFITDDTISYSNLLNAGGNHFDYFSGMLKVFQVNHGLFEQDSFLSGKWTKNKAHSADIYQNFVIADVVWVSPVLRSILGRTLPQFFSKDLISSIRNKLLTLPPPGYYKLTDAPATQPKAFNKGLVFLWNHRFTASKRPKVFFGAIAEFHRRWPDVRISVRVCTLSSEQETMEFVPDELKSFVVYSPFLYDREAYAEFIRPANITIGTSEIESFGIAVLDCIRQGINYVNLDCNKAFRFLVGCDDTSASAKELATRIHQLYCSSDARVQNHTTNLRALSNLPDYREAKQILKSAIVRLYDEKLKTTSGDKSAVVKKLLASLNHSALTKKQLYQATGWPTPKTCRNAFWPDYYYALRKNGVKTTQVNSTTMYYLDPATLPSATSVVRTKVGRLF